MAEEGKKISFGFSKTVKKPLVKNVEEKKLDYIECVDDKAIKIIGKEEKKNEPLVIPMLGSKTWHDRIINKVDADIFEPKQTDTPIKEEPNEVTEIKKEKDDTQTNGNTQNEDLQPMEIDGVRIKEEPKDVEPSEPMTLEQQAAQEILADLKAKDNDSKEQKTFTVPMGDDDLKGKEESTLEDYENIPIEAFGMAMLRGMGWKAEEGVGKNAKVIAPAIPELRPKGMGLGADKLAIQKTKAKLTKEEENLKIVKGCCVKIIAGKQSGNYGKIEGLDDDSGRILVRLALGNQVVSLVNELLVQPVTNEEYSKNSRVLNMKAYEDHKNKEENNFEKGNVKKENNIKKQSDVRNFKKERESSRSEEDSNDSREKRSKKSKKKSKSRKDESSEDESSPERKSRRKRDSSSSSDDDSRRKKSKKSKNRKDESSEHESSPERKSRKKRDSSKSSDDDSKRKKTKKSKKHKSRDSSAERSSRKNKKKDKEREKSRYKKSDYSDPSERARNRDRRRSRSRSYSPKSRRRNRSRS